MNVSRVCFWGLAFFCVVMNGLVWRVHYGGARAPGSEVGVTNLVYKILEAPDPSDLQIKRGVDKIGYARWIPRIVEPEREAPADSTAEPDRPDDALEGMVVQALGYGLDFDGSLTPVEGGKRYRFLAKVRLGTDLKWETMEFRLVVRPNVIHVQLDAARQDITIRMENNVGTLFETTLTLDELQDPGALFGKLGLPWAAELLDPWVPADLRQAKADWTWRAYKDRFRFGRSTLVGYRLEATLANRFDMTAVISRAGEILQLDLPGGVTVVNEAISLREEVRP